MYKEYCDLLYEEILTEMRRKFVKDYKEVFDKEFTKEEPKVEITININ